MKIRIGITNYGQYSKFIEQIEKTLPEDIELVVLNDLFSELESSIRRIEARRSVDVFVGSGGNADFLEKYLKDIPMVRVKVTGFDLLNALKEVRMFSDHAAIITRRTPLSQLEEVRELLNVQVETATYNRQEDIDDILCAMFAQGIRDVIGSAFVLERASLMGMRGHFIWSLDGIKEAIGTAIALARNIKNSAEQAKKLNYILDYSAEGIILTDREGIITDFNTSAERILQRKRSSVIGKSCRDVLPNTQLHVVMEQKQPQYNKIQDLGNVKIVTNRSPIMYNDEMIGSLATFFSVSNIRKAEASIRQNQFQTRYLAQNSFYSLIGKSGAWNEMKKKAEQYARCDAAVLICGRSGAGKEVIAQCVHNGSPRKGERFVTVHCAAFSPAQLERELFGYEEGTVPNGKRNGRSGAVELAHQGTLFLDGVSDIPIKLQARLLHVIENKEVLRIGGDAAIPVDIRVVATTGRDLWEMVQDNTFREDLYYRLNVLRIDVPELKERREDIPLLIQAFIGRLRSDLASSEMEQISNLPCFQSYDWPGNIQELRNIIERFCIMFQPGMDMEELAAQVMEQPVVSRQVNQEERQRLLTALRDSGWNRERAADLLGMSRTTLWRKLKEYQISSDF